MYNLVTSVMCLVIGFLAGFVGSLLGIGGGSLTTPTLILYGVEAHRAVAASLVAILGTSLGGIFHLYKRGLVRVKTAFILESASITGAFIGASLAIRLPSNIVALIVASALILSAILFVIIPVEKERKSKLGLRKPYIVAWVISLAAGFLSATAGIGGGIVKTPVLTLILGLSVKSAVSTSKLMVGITAGTGAITYGISGHIDPYIAVPLVIGTYTGAWVGARVLTRIKAKNVRVIAVLTYVIFATSLLIRAIL
ncbi:MAG: hypothetical protein B6U85_03710 [Desulfurococcales archaeon ex4484_42]|nr:MAG: hypothetical protein B6U85_03710 [Desulfurococcales archaeon ex4484_42]